MKDSDHSPDHNVVSVVCPQHGVRYNPQVSDGCVICRRDRQEAGEDSEQGGRWGLMTASVLGLVLVVLVISAVLRPSDRAQAADQKTPPKPRTVMTALSEQGLDPQPFRPQIERLEKLLYQGSPSAPLGGEIESAVAELAKQVGQQSSPLVGTAVTLRLLTFKDWIGARSDVGYGVLDLSQARLHWESEVRDKVFLPADWFQSARSGSARR
ncbi:MAG TPA: hypothetical protein VLU25_06900 [Acidobacteriota bacterium]|nr:hypothetical protein [Acidobacteriota bacterium]